LQAVLQVVYLIFNEGYSATGGERLARGELCSEAIRLGRLLATLMPDDAEILGLLAMMLLHDSRRGARVDGDGHYVAFDDQDRSQWDQGRIREGQRLLERAMRLRHPGSYQVQAAITALHLEAPLASDTDWDQIAELYSALAHISPSPIIDVNRCSMTRASIITSRYMPHTPSCSDETQICPARRVPTPARSSSAPTPLSATSSSVGCGRSRFSEGPLQACPNRAVCRVVVNEAAKLRRHFGPEASCPAQ
jgi:hypothetical protein